MILLAVLITTPAAADELVLSAAPLPIVTVQINGKPARLQVDTFLPPAAAIDPAAARRLGVRAVPLVKGEVGNGYASLMGRLARPRVTFPSGRTVRLNVGLFNVPYSTAPGLDGAIGAGALPYDRVRIVLRDGAPGAMTHAFPLAEADQWVVAAPLAGMTGHFRFNLARAETLLSRSATRRLQEASQLTPIGALGLSPYPLGLSTPTQRVQTSAAIGGFPFGPTLARTEVALAAPDGEDAVSVIARDKKRPDYMVTLGRQSIAACSDMVWERAAKRLTLHCDF